MGFLKSGNQHDIWLRFCRLNSEILEQTGLPDAAIKTEHCYRDLLRDGVTKIGRDEVYLSHLTEFEWLAFESFTGIFFHEFESYAPLELFPAFRREAERRKRRR